MLRSLYVRDFALIEELDVEFDAGLNIITGETGAGKSILIGALQMILGERASTDSVRSGAAKAVIEGIFDEADDPSIRSVLEENAIDQQPMVILRREITSTQSRGFINDSPATLQVMREVASHLIDLHGQHEHQSLLKVATHLELVDSFAGLAEERARYEEHYAAVASLIQDREQLRSRQREMEQKKELYGFQIEEIDRIGPQEGEQDALESERRVLENAEQLFEATTKLYDMLFDGDRAVHDQLVVIRDELRNLARIDQGFEETLDEIDSACIVASEAASFLQDYSADVEFNPERLEEIRDRLGELDRLKRKYGGTMESVLAHRREIGEAYEAAQDFEGTLKRLGERIRDSQRALSVVAGELSARRRQAAVGIEEAVQEECAKLGMPNCRFQVRFDAVADAEGWIFLEDARDGFGGMSLASDDDAERGSGGGQGNAHTDGSARSSRRLRAFESGADRVEFYISTNLGEEPKPLTKIASGGEISRIMLALKTILAKHQKFPILVFDEIDAGISGSVASKVGQSMHDLASSHQIIAITHLPQIAARGDVHCLVEKYIDGGRTKTRIRRLSEHHRAEHVAGLMSGADVTEAALQSARELMNAAKR